MKVSTKLAIVLLVCSTLNIAYAVEMDTPSAVDEDLLAATKASVSMIDAINAAVKEVSGTPVTAEFENSDGEGAEARWFIEIISGKATIDLEVDATTGKVTRLADDPVEGDVVQSEDASPTEVPHEKADK
ncbi:PepSY domain-containing protein [Thiothrix lacustris]|uniref:PepSY domain-containing protein n=1 Tax=Thiothrix lacustris TaxID=525917 RepID=UPI0027E3D7EC|nr:PepSY domain-containing protein [Thiothrix lacustris]WMP18780.1 PepSY domain-containing protein [Thiothrix lacustris]